MSQGSRAGGDNPIAAVCAIVFAVFGLSLGDALIKEISAGFPLWQIFIVRSVIALPLLLLLVKGARRAVALRPLHLGWTSLRSLMLALMWVVYYAALPKVALSVAAAAYYTLPLFITLFAGLFVGERVGLQGWIAVFLGFSGVLLILKPQGEDFNAYALLPLVSAVLYALAMIITRTKCQAESPLVLSLALNLAFILVGLLGGVVIWGLGPSAAAVEAEPFLLGRWIPMGPKEWLAGALLALAVIIGSAFAAYAYQRGPASMVSTFDFAYLAFAALWGYLFFAEVPDGITVAGIFLIATAGVLAVRRRT